MENQTLIIALTLVSIVSSLALFVNWAGNRHIPGLLLIALGASVSCVGILLLTTQGSWSPLLSVMLANALILGGRLPVLMGLGDFWNQEKTKLPLLCALFLLLAMAGIYYFTYVVESIFWRIRVYTAMMVFFHLCSIYLIARGLQIEQKLRPAMSISSKFGAFLTLMLFAFNAVTEFILMQVRTGAPLAANDEGTSLLLLGSIFTQIVFAFAIIIMTMEELSVEHNENAIYDPVTTILNHRTFLEIGQRVLGVALRYSQPVSLLTISVQNMDEVVKKHGYKVGNEMLRHFSLMASDRRRHEDVLARSSFNEFHMLLPGVDENGARVVMEKINKALTAEEYIYRGSEMKVEVFMAAITRREEDLNLQQMLQEGEIELFRAKDAAKTAAAYS